MRRNKGFVLVAAAACLASTGISRADIGLLTSLADWGGSAAAPGGYSANGVQMGWPNNQNPNPVTPGEAKQFGNQGVGYYVSGNGSVANIDANANTVTYTAAAATTNITTNGLFNLNNDFAAPNGSLDQPTIGTSWAGLTGGVGGATITAFPGGYDVIGTGELLPGGSSKQIATTLQTGTAFAFDYTTPLGGTTLATATGAYFSTAIVGNTSINGVYTRFFTGNGDGTLATKNNAATYTGDTYGDQGSFIVNHGTYYTVYLPYNQGALQTANANVPNNINFSTLTSLQLDLEVNGDATDYGAGGSINLSNLREVTPTWAPITTTTGTVTGNNSGSWTLNTSTIDTNWIGGLPNAAGVSATFSSLITSNATVTLDAQQTVGSIIFNDSAFSYTIAPGTGGSLVLDNTTATPIAPATITDFAGQHSITAPITLNSSAVVTTTSATDSVTLSGNISGVGGLSAGGPGTTVIGGTNTYGGSTSVTGGTLSVTSHTALPTGTAVSIASGQMVLAVGAGDPTIGTLTITSGGGLNINNNRMFLSDTPGEAATVIAYLKTGFASGWAGPSGIFSTTAAHTAGYGVAFGQGSVFSHIPSGQIEVSYTLNGDINQDGAVNGTDFGILAANFGKNVSGGWEQGDFTYAGKVNATDFGLLAANFGKTATGQAISVTAADWAALDAFAAQYGLTAALPEPASLGLLAVASVGILNRRRRK